MRESEVFALWCGDLCHATALGEDNEYYDPDRPGVACNLAAQGLANPAGSKPVVALADSTGADITPMQCDGAHGTALAQQVGQAVGDGIVQPAQQAARNAGGFAVETHFTELSALLEPIYVICRESSLSGTGAHGRSERRLSAARLMVIVLFTRAPYAKQDFRCFLRSPGAAVRRSFDDPRTARIAGSLRRPRQSGRLRRRNSSWADRMKKSMITRPRSRWT